MQRIVGKKFESLQRKENGQTSFSNFQSKSINSTFRASSFSIGNISRNNLLLFTQRKSFSTKSPFDEDDDVIKSLQKIEQAVLSQLKGRKEEEKLELDNEHEYDLEKKHEQELKIKRQEQVKREREVFNKTYKYPVVREKGELVDLNRYRDDFNQIEENLFERKPAEEEFYERCLEALERRDRRLLETGETTKGILLLKRWRLHLVNYFQRVELAYKRIKDIEILKVKEKEYRKYDNSSLTDTHQHETDNKLNLERAKIAESIREMTSDLLELQKRFGSTSIKNMSDIETARRQYYPQNAPFTASKPSIVPDLQEELSRWLTAQKLEKNKNFLDKADVPELDNRNLVDYIDRIVTEHYFPRRVDYEVDHDDDLTLEDEEPEKEYGTEDDDNEESDNALTRLLDELYRPDIRSNSKEYYPQFDGSHILDEMDESGRKEDLTQFGFPQIEDIQDEKDFQESIQEIDAKLSNLTSEVTSQKEEEKKVYPEDIFAKTGEIKDDTEEEEDVFAGSGKKSKFNQDEAEVYTFSPLLSLRERIVKGGKRAELQDYFMKIRNYSEGYSKNEQILRESGYPRLVPTLRTVKLYHEKFGRNFHDDEEIIFGCLEYLDDFSERLKDFVDGKQALLNLEIVPEVIEDAFNVLENEEVELNTPEFNEFKEAIIGYKGGRLLENGNREKLLGHFGTYEKNLEAAPLVYPDLSIVYTDAEIKFFAALKKEAKRREDEINSHKPEEKIKEANEDLLSRWTALSMSISGVLDVKEKPKQITELVEGVSSDPYDKFNIENYDEVDVIRGKISAESWKHEKFYENGDLKAIREGDVSTLIPERDGDELIPFKTVERTVHSLDLLRDSHGTDPNLSRKSYNGNPPIKVLPFKDEDRKTYGSGHRKAAAAFVRIKKGTGIININNTPILEYFPHILHRCGVLAPLVAVERLNYFDVEISVKGGGFTGSFF